MASHVIIFLSRRSVTGFSATDRSCSTGQMRFSPLARFDWPSALLSGRRRTARASSLDVIHGAGNVRKRRQGRQNLRRTIAPMRNGEVVKSRPDFELKSNEPPPSPNGNSGWWCVLCVVELPVFCSAWTVPYSYQFRGHFMRSNSLLWIAIKDVRGHSFHHACAAPRRHVGISQRCCRSSPSFTSISASDSASPKTFHQLVRSLGFFFFFFLRVGWRDCQLSSYSLYARPSAS